MSDNKRNPGDLNFKGGPHFEMWVDGSVDVYDDEGHECGSLTAEQVQELVSFLRPLPIPVTERLPEDDREVMVHWRYRITGGADRAICRLVDGVWYYDDKTFKHHFGATVITHWSEIAQLTEVGGG